MSSMHYEVRHETLYRYRRDVAHSHQQLRLTPRESARQHTLQHHIRISPQPSVRVEYLDAFGNVVTRVELDRPHHRLHVVAAMQVSVASRPAIDVGGGDRWELVREQLCYAARPRDAAWLEAMRFRGESPYVRVKRVFGDFARDCLVPGASIAAACAALMGKINREFTYAPGSTEITTPLMEVLEQRTGVCQDFAHLMIACLRSAGLAARYVSGYLRTDTPGLAAAGPVVDAAHGDEDGDGDGDGEQDWPDEDREDGGDGARLAQDAAGAAAAGGGRRLRGADASHAWVEVFAPPFGWLGFDPTNDVMVDQDHVALAWGRDFGDVSPLRGVILGGGSHRLNVRVTVRPIAAAR